MMTAHLRQLLTPFNFAGKYPRAHILIGGFDPAHVIAAEEPSRLDVLSTVLGGLGIVGEYSAAENRPTATLKLWFARGEDAARLCAFVKAMPRPSYGESITTACFTYDRLFHERFKPAVWAKRPEDVKAVLMRRG